MGLFIQERESICTLAHSIPRFDGVFDVMSRPSGHFILACKLVSRDGHLSLLFPWMGVYAPLPFLYVVFYSTGFTTVKSDGYGAGIHGLLAHDC